MLQAVEAAAGLHRRVQVGGGEGQPARLAGTVAARPRIQAERVRGIGLLGGNHAAAGPLGPRVAPRMRPRTLPSRSTMVAHIWLFRPLVSALTAAVNAVLRVA